MGVCGRDLRVVDGRRRSGGLDGGCRGRRGAGLDGGCLDRRGACHLCVARPFLQTDLSACHCGRRGGHSHDRGLGDRLFACRRDFGPHVCRSSILGLRSSWVCGEGCDEVSGSASECALVVVLCLLCCSQLRSEGRVKACLRSLGLLCGGGLGCGE